MVVSFALRPAFPSLTFQGALADRLTSQNISVAPSAQSGTSTPPKWLQTITKHNGWLPINDFRKNEFKQYFTEVEEGPQVIINHLNSSRDSRPTAIQQWAFQPGVSHFVFVGEGSSLNAAKMAGKAFEGHGFAVSYYNPLEAKALLEQELKNKVDSKAFENTYFVLISQSGTTGVLVDYAEALTNSKLVDQNNIAVVTNTTETQKNNTPTLKGMFPNTTIQINAGNEASIASTKAVLGTMGAINSILPKSLQKNFPDGFSTAIRNLTNPDYLSNAGSLGILQQWSKKLNTGIESSSLFKDSTLKNNELIILGPATYQPLLNEITLKLRETALGARENYNTESFKHGPRTVLELEQPLLVILPPGSKAQEGVLNELYDSLSRFELLHERPYNPEKIFVVAPETHQLSTAAIRTDVKKRNTAFTLTKNPVLKVPDLDNALAHQTNVLYMMQLFCGTLTQERLNVKILNNPFLDKSVMPKQ